MDNKSSDDSAGSDSLDKSLQKKCVVDDASDGVLRQKSAAAAVPSGSVALATKNSADPHKTEIGAVGDGAGGGVATIASALTQQQVELADCNVSVSASSRSSGAVPKKSARHTSTDTTNIASCSKASSNSPHFETRVKQIANDLKETSLMDADRPPEKADVQVFSSFAALDDASNSSSASSQDSDDEQVTDVKKVVETLPASQASTSKSSANPMQPEETELESSLCSTEANDDDDTHNSRSKKVRFHPEVKEHDGGNRVIPKKKKKSKESKRSTEQEMELDEEEDDAAESVAAMEEEDYSLPSLLAEADDYLKKNPLFIDRSPDAQGTCLREGLLEEEDLKSLPVQEDQETDIYADSAPAENGVERILGKLIKNQEITYLVRYVDKPTIAWESEEFVTKNCPTLLNDYEKHCLKLQERLMNHVSRCQTMRQRYTDF